MSKVFEICIADKSGNEMIKVTNVQAVAEKGIINDRYFNENNDVDTHITLIESENIDYYNLVSGSNISYFDTVENDTLTINFSPEYKAQAFL